MKVLKFGGTSVGSPDRMKNLLDIIKPKDKQIVVLSAVSGTTNSLLEISQAYLAEDKPKAAELIAALKAKYEIFIKDLFSSDEAYENGKDLIDYHFNLLSSFSPLFSKTIINSFACDCFFKYEIHKSKTLERHNS
jgi:aspartate kinase